ncbi:DUF1700 domain-containing protein [Phytoactinopolyspora limicola]|uniref:DUF1700 domain-containing protein n=1 Tax=Phytoactinopolyspora limicola TaxID=2715536 RepID=UPI00140E6507|nr:hypothetical protein [Phytoactinopolyspora limicola]
MNAEHENVDPEGVVRDNTERRDTHPAVVWYLGEIRDATADLDADEQADILSDVREHLDAVAAELGEGLSGAILIARLGSPAQYAADLRAAAGLRARPPSTRVGVFRRAVRFLAAVMAGAALACAGIGVAGVLFVGPEAMAWLAASLVASVTAVACILALATRADDRSAELHSIPGAAYVLKADRWLRRQPWGEPALGYTRSLRPAWWLVRAAIVGLAVGYVSSAGLGLAVFFAAAVASVWLGLRAVDGRLAGDWRTAMVGVNAAALVAGVAVASSMVSSAGQVFYADTWPDHDEYYADEYQPQGDYIGDTYGEQWLADGENVSNIFPYGPDGELLIGVRLYNQDGTPLVLPAPNCVDAPWGESFSVADPWGSNVYPRLSSMRDDEHGYDGDVYLDGDVDDACTEPSLDAPYGVHLPTVDLETKSP